MAGGLCGQACTNACGLLYGLVMMLICNIIKGTHSGSVCVMDTLVIDISQYLLLQACVSLFLDTNNFTISDFS
jgi:hypothetical protein